LPILAIGHPGDQPATGEKGQHVRSLGDLFDRGSSKSKDEWDDIDPGFSLNMDKLKAIDPGFYINMDKLGEIDPGFFIKPNHHKLAESGRMSSTEGTHLKVD
jgi:hypothetical protein